MGAIPAVFGFGSQEPGIELHQPWHRVGSQGIAQLSAVPGKKSECFVGGAGRGVGAHPQFQDCFVCPGIIDGVEIAERPGPITGKDPGLGAQSVRFDPQSFPAARQQLPHFAHTQIGARCGTPQAEGLCDGRCGVLCLTVFQVVPGLFGQKFCPPQIDFSGLDPQQVARGRGFNQPGGQHLS